MKLLKFLIFLSVAVFLPVKQTVASGFIANNIFVQSVPTESRAVIFYDGNKETIFDSITFNINPVIVWSFAYVVAVPSKPTVQIVTDDILTKFEKISEKKFSKDSVLDKILYLTSHEEKNVPLSLYTRPVSLIRYEVFSPEKTVDDLKSFLAIYGYQIPKTAYHILEEYRQNGWYIIAADVSGTHIQTDASESLTVTGGHTLPLKIEFETDKIVYPFKLIQVQPDLDAEDVPFSFPYGTKSEDLFDSNNVKIDDMLSEPSKNKEPRLPFDYSYHKLELFVLADKKYEADNLTTTFADNVNLSSLEFKDKKGNTYFEPNEEFYYLTRLHAFVPTLQANDVYLEAASSNQRVNSAPPLIKNPVIYFVLVPLLILSVFVITKIKSSKETQLEESEE